MLFRIPVGAELLIPKRNTPKNWIEAPGVRPVVDDISLLGLCPQELEGG